MRKINKNPIESLRSVYGTCSTDVLITAVNSGRCVQDMHFDETPLITIKEDVVIKSVVYTEEDIKKAIKEG